MYSPIVPLNPLNFCKTSITLTVKGAD